MRHLDNKLSFALLAIAWIVVNVLLFQKYGIRVVNDSARYIEYANGLASGFYVDIHNIWYIGYSYYLVLIFKLSGSSVVAVVVGQYVLSFFAMLALYRAAFLFWNSAVSAFIACLLFIGFIDVQMWNSYVLTESLYGSFICFSLYCLVSIHKRTQSTAFVVLTVFVVLFTCFVKPTGVALLVAVAAVVLYNALIKVRSLPVRAGAISMVVILVVLLVNRMLTTYLVIENYQAGEIIYGVSLHSQQEVVSRLIVDRPADLFVPSPDDQPVVRILLFVIHHPVYWAKLFFFKIGYLLSHVRPFWSTFHNIFSLAILLPCYFFFVVGMRAKGVDRTIIIFSMSFLLVHVLSVGITSDDWDGRFLIPMLPLIFIFSGKGMERLFRTNGTTDSPGVGDFRSV